MVVLEPVLVIGDEPANRLIKLGDIRAGEGIFVRVVDVDEVAAFEGVGEEVLIDKFELGSN